MSYEKERGGGLSQTKEIDGTTGVLRLTLKADAIRQERTGVHARVSVAANGVVLAWSNFNVEKDEERVRLGNSAYKNLNGYAKDYTAVFLKKDIDNFVRGLWEAYTATDAAEMVPGLATYETPVCLLHPYIVEGGGTILYAPPGRGKSWTLLLMAVSVDSGSNILWPVVQKPVLFINLERSKRSLQNRLGVVNRVLGLDPQRPLRMMNARGRSLSDIYGAAERSVEEGRCECVALDSISRAGAGDLKENAPVNKIMDMMNALAPSWVGIGHTPRGEEDHVYGSIHFEAGADVMLKMTSQHIDNMIGVGLKVTKDNDIGAHDLEVIALEFTEGQGLTKARPARRNEFLEIEQGGGPVDRRSVVLTYLHKVGAATATQIAKETGFNRSALYDMLGKDTDHFLMARKVGSEVYWGAVS